MSERFTQNEWWCEIHRAPWHRPNDVCDFIDRQTRQGNGVATHSPCSIRVAKVSVELGDYLGVPPREDSE